MVYCEECNHYNGKCTNPKGVLYGKIIDIDLDILCPAYRNSNGEEDGSNEADEINDTEFLSGMIDPEIREFMGFTF